jgi:hypothetical protein
MKQRGGVRPHRMNVVLHQLLKREDGAIELQISFGDGPVRTFLAAYQGADPKYKFCSVDEELFMRLSELSHERFGNCAVYHMELMNIITAFTNGVELPPLPATLGTTRFCTLKPGRMGILWNKFRILLQRMGLYHPRGWVHSA